MKNLLLFIIITIAGTKTFAQWETYNLSSYYQQNRLEAYNRKVGILEDDLENGIRINEQKGEGVIWLKDVAFDQGTIEIDLKGKDEFQKSFLGIAFQGKDSLAYEAIYFRPFNFRAENPERKSHAVQYVSHPKSPWRVLRQNFPGKFENGITPAVNPNEWFHARIEVKETVVSVFVNDQKTASLEITRIATAPGKKIGLWVGEGSGGDFANLKITRTGRLSSR